MKTPSSADARRTLQLNVLAALATLAVSAWIAAPTAGAGEQRGREESLSIVSAQTAIVHEGGKPGLRDATGLFLPLGEYKRIIGASGAADSLLHALCEPDRVLAYTRFSSEPSSFSYRFAGKPTVMELSSLERIISLDPDLVLTNSIGSRQRIERLREAGLKVFDLGDQRGLRTLLPNIVSVATLLGRRQAGLDLAARFERRMQAIARHIPQAERPTGLYAAVYGEVVYGGTRETSYFDVLEAAGVRDAAAAGYTGWPRFTAEQLLDLNPEVLITHEGMAHQLCAVSGLDRLAACQRVGRARVVEVDGALLDNPGLTMLEAAEAVYEAVHLRK